MADWSQQEGQRCEYFPSIPNPATGITVTGSGSIHTMGAWAALCTAPFDVGMIQISIVSHSSTSDYLVDIGVGASGSEQVVIPTIITGGPSSSNKAKTFFFPLAVPVGQRIVARCQNATASATLKMTIGVWAQSFNGLPSLTRFVTYGAVLTTSSGAALANPGAGAWGAWTTITPVGGAVDDVTWWCPILSDQDRTSNTAEVRSYQVGVSSGTIIPIMAPLFFSGSSTAEAYNVFPGFWSGLPPGSILSGRYSCVAATNLGIDMVIVTGCD